MTHPLRKTKFKALSAPLTLAKIDSGSHYPPASRSNVQYINQTPWSSTMSPSTVAAYPQMQPTPTLPSSPYVLPSSPQSTAWPNQSSALYPEAFQGPRSRAASGSDISRSSSPNPAELRNFGYPLPDGCVCFPLIHGSEGEDILTFTFLGEAGDALIQDAIPQLSLHGVATCASIFAVTQNHSSADMRTVRSQPREAFQAKRTATDTRQSTDLEYPASGKGAKGCSVA